MNRYFVWEIDVVFDNSSTWSLLKPISNDGSDQGSHKWRIFRSGAFIENSVPHP